DVVPPGRLGGPRAHRSALPRPPRRAGPRAGAHRGLPAADRAGNHPHDAGFRRRPHDLPASGPMSVGSAGPLPRKGEHLTRDATERSTELPGALSVAAHDVTEAVRVVTGHLDRLMTGVLSYVRSCVEPPEIEDVQLDLALEEAARPLRDQLSARDARIAAADLPTLRADAGRTRDLLRALLSNAVTFASDDP